MQISLNVVSDEKGYLDRECPNEECEYVFKVYLEDWEQRVSDEIVYCPRCGHNATSDQWWTKEQLEHIEQLAMSFAMSYVQKTFENSLKKMSRASGKYFKISYKPGKKISFTNNPLGQREEWEMEITCNVCETRTSVVGFAFFCPCCGKNAVDRLFQESMERLVKQMDSLNEMKGLLEKLHGRDTAVNMTQGMIESSLKEVVSAFQKFAVESFRKGSEKPVRPNDFQMVEKGSDLFSNHFGEGYDAWISDDEIRYMIIMFQRRHILEHNNGIVDEKYLNNSADNTYRLGQRIICKEDDVRRLIVIIEKLSEGIKLLSESIEK